MPFDPLSLVMIAMIGLLVIMMVRNGKKRREQMEQLQQASAVQSNRRIVVVGRIRRNDDDQFGIVRLKTNGDYDRSFSDDGRLIVDFDGGSDTARDVALQANGRIVVAGEGTDRGRRRFGVVRLLAS